MKILLRNSIAFLLIFTMVFTLGVSSFSEDISFQEGPLEIFTGDDKTVAEDVYGEEDIDIGGGGNIGDIDISDNKGGTVAEDVYGRPTSPALPYTIKYYLDEVEQMEWEINDAEVSIDNPEVTAEDIPTPEDLPEGYVIDEKNSTLPFTVTEDVNVIMVYYEAITEGEEMTLSFESDGVRVEVSGLLPLGTQLRLDPISETDMDMYLNAIEAQTGMQIGIANLFDISLLDAEGNVIQPNDEVRVSFYGLDHIKADDDVFVYHVEQTNTVAGRYSMMSANDVEIEGFDPIVESGRISFNTNHFSIYIVGTETRHENSNNRYQMNVGDTVNLEVRHNNNRTGGNWTVDSGGSNVSFVGTPSNSPQNNIKATVKGDAEGSARIRYRKTGLGSFDHSFYIRVNAVIDPPAVYPGDPKPTNITPGKVITSKKAAPVGGMVNTWDVTVRIEAEDTVQTSDIILLIDTSGSMKGSRISAAKEAANNFINTLLPNTNINIGIATFATDTSSTPLSQNKDGLSSFVNALDANGGTFTQAGIQVAQELLKNSSANRKYIVLLSDGEPTYSYGMTNVTSRLNNTYFQQRGSSSNWDSRDYFDPSPFSTTRVGSGQAGNSPNAGSTGGRTYYYNHGNSTIAEGRYTKLAGTIIYSIAFEAGSEGERVLSNVATQGNYYTATTADLGTIFNEIAGGISSTVQAGTLTDVMGDGFEIPAGNVAEIQTSQGTATYDAGSKTLNWDLEGPISGDKRVLGKPTYRYAEITYRVEINNEMIALNLDKEENALHPTNKSIAFDYEDPNGAEVIITDLTQGQGLTSPEVDPVLLKIKKILSSPMDQENRIFNVEISKATPDSFNQTVELVPNAEYVWLTTLRHEGTYNVAETSINGDGITDLNQFDISYKIGGSEATSFEVNHPGGKPRGDVTIEVTNKLIPQTVNVTVKKQVTGNLGDLTREFDFKVIVNEDSANPYNFNLGHNGVYELKDIPKDADLTLTEESGTYVVTVKVNGENLLANPDKSYTIKLGVITSEFIEIEVTNDNTVPIDTGITFDTMPYILILSLTTIGLGTGVVRKRNIRKED